MSTTVVAGIPVAFRHSEAGWAWRWRDSHGVQHELEWVEGRHLWLRGTRVHPGGWLHNELQGPEWDEPDSVEDAEAAVLALVEREVGQ